MSKTAHRLFLLTLTFIVIAVFIYISYYGSSFYKTVEEERFFHHDFKALKPSGLFGHAFGIFGSAFMLIGVMVYMLRKRFRTFSRFGLLKHWLEFHIFLCTLGPVLVLFHTSFKFGGIVAISFWSMVAVVLSGIIGRFIYIQIPRSIEGRELTLSEVNNLKTDLEEILKKDTILSENQYLELTELTKKKAGLYYSNIFVRLFNNYKDDKQSIKKVKDLLKKLEISTSEKKKLLRILRNEISLNRKIERLNMMQNLLKYWHVAHLPFAFIMLIVMIVHVVIAVMFGSKWIF